MNCTKMNIFRNLTIDGSNSKKICFDIFTKETSRAKPVIIFAHGFKGFKDWGCWDLVATFFANNGFNFIKFNFSHNGTTPQNPLEFDDLEAFGENNFTKELFDLNQMLNYVQNEKLPFSDDEINRNEIYLIGHSRGAGTCILKAQNDNRIKKMVLWAAQTNFNSYFQGNLDVWKHNKVRFILNGRTMQNMPLNWQFAEDFLKNKDHYNPQNALKHIDIPLLFIFGEIDNVVEPLNINDLNYNHSSITCISIKEANHVFGGKHPFDDLELPSQINQLLNESKSFLES